MRHRAGLVLAFVASALAPQTRWPTVGEIVAELRTTTEGLPGDFVSKRLTSYSTLADAELVAFAGYEARAAGMLEPPLYVALKSATAPGDKRRS